MAIKPCDRCLKLSCDYCQYCTSLLVVIILQTEVYKWPQFGTNGSICCHARNISRVQSFDCNRLWYIAYCNIIAILKIMQYNNCSSTLLRYCNNIELLPSGNRTPGSRFYSDLLDTSADSVCIHQLCQVSFKALGCSYNFPLPGCKDYVAQFFPYHECNNQPYTAVLLTWYHVTV